MEKEYYFEIKMYDPETKKSLGVFMGNMTLEQAIQQMKAWKDIYKEDTHAQ